MLAFVAFVLITVAVYLTVTIESPIFRGMVARVGALVLTSTVSVQGSPFFFIVT